MANLNDIIERTLHTFDETWEDRMATLLLLYASSEGSRRAEQYAEATRENMKVLLATSMRAVAREMGKAVVLQPEHSNKALKTEEWQLLERVWNACQIEVERKVRNFIGSTNGDP